MYLVAAGVLQTLSSAFSLPNRSWPHASAAEPGFTSSDRPRPSTPRTNLFAFSASSSQRGYAKKHETLLRALLLVMTIKCTGGETGEYFELAMPENLTSDLGSVSKLMSEVNSKDFPRVFEELLEQVHDFGSLFMEFGSSKNNRTKSQLNIVSVRRN